jgi:hypothetical protein
MRMKKPNLEPTWWLFALGASAAIGIGFLAQDLADWIAELLFSCDWARSPRIASTDAVEPHG